MAALTREQAVERLERGRQTIHELQAHLTQDEMTRPATIGGGDWSAKDLLGHIAFWEELALEALADWRASRPFAVVEILEAGQAGTDAANARNQKRTRPMTLDQVLERASRSSEDVVGAIRALPDDDWQRQVSNSGTTPITLGGLLGGVLAGAPEYEEFEHDFAHLDDLRAYVDSLSQR